MIYEAMRKAALGSHNRPAFWLGVSRRTEKSEAFKITLAPKWVGSDSCQAQIRELVLILYHGIGIRKESKQYPLSWARLMGALPL